VVTSDGFFSTVEEEESDFFKKRPRAAVREGMREADRVGTTFLQSVIILSVRE